LSLGKGQSYGIPPLLTAKRERNQGTGRGTSSYPPVKEGGIKYRSFSGEKKEDEEVLARGKGSALVLIF